MCCLVAITALSGCAVAPATAAPQRSVRLLLNGLAGGQHAGFTSARGYYADEGLDVTMAEGRGSADTVQQVAAGTADFGFADAISIAGSATSVAVVSSIFQSSALALLSLQAQPIARPSDLHGKSVGATPGTVARVLLNALLSKNALDDVAIVDLAPADMVPALVSGRVAAIVGARDFEALQLQARGEAVVELSFADAGARLVGLSLIANTDLVRRDPQVVAGFVRASLRGWNVARTDPHGASRALVGQFLAGYEGEVDAQLQADLPLLCPGDTAVAGLPSESAWSETLQLASSLGLVASAPPPASNFVTTSFIPADAPRC